MLRNFFLVFALVQLVSQAAAACTAPAPNAAWMQALGAGGRSLSQLFLLGSHDAGCDVVNSKSRVARWTSNDRAITQLRNFENQMCQGYRFFDVRFKHDGTSWRIFHGWNGIDFFFDTLVNVATSVNNFCTAAAHSQEVVMLRIKTEGGDSQGGATDPAIAVNDFINRIGTCALAQASYANNVATSSLATVLGMARVTPAAPAPGAVIILKYDVRDDNGVLNNYANYGTVMYGKATSASKTKKVIQGQAAKFATYRGLNPQPPLFGWWINFYGGKVLPWAYSRIGDNNGKYRNYLHKLIAGGKFGLNGASLPGKVFVTDSAGDAQWPSFIAAMIQINTNIIAGAALDNGLAPPAAVGTALPAFLSTSSHLSTLNKKFKMRSAQKSLTAVNDGAGTLPATLVDCAEVDTDASDQPTWQMYGEECWQRYAFRTDDDFNPCDLTAEPTVHLLDPTPSCLLCDDASTADEIVDFLDPTHECPTPDATIAAAVSALTCCPDPTPAPGKAAPALLSLGAV